MPHAHLKKLGLGHVTVSTRMETVVLLLHPLLVYTWLVGGGRGEELLRRVRACLEFTYAALSFTVHMADASYVPLGLHATRSA